MSDRRKPATAVVSVDRRAAELDPIAAVLPINRRDELAELLTDRTSRRCTIWPMEEWGAVQARGKMTLQGS